MELLCRDSNGNSKIIAIGILLATALLSVTSLTARDASASTQYFISADLGQTYGTLNQDNTVILGSIAGHPIPSQFHNTLTQPGKDWGLEAGIETTFNPMFSILWGLGLYQTPKIHVEGSDYLNTSVTPCPCSTTATYLYNYNLKNTRLLFSMTERYRIFVWPQLSLLTRLAAGLGWLTADGFSATPQTQVQYPPNFNNHTELKLNYEAGIGAEYGITKALSVGLRYDWIFLGSADFATGSNQTTGEVLSSGPIHFQRSSIQLSYYF